MTRRLLLVAPTRTTQRLNGLRLPDERAPFGPMTGKTVLVTGGTGGTGKATTVGLAALDARVAVTGRDEPNSRPPRKARADQVPSGAPGTPSHRYAKSTAYTAPAPAPTCSQR